jgi:hypothetical protein
MTEQFLIDYAKAWFVFLPILIWLAVWTPFERWFPIETR